MFININNYICNSKQTKIMEDYDNDVLGVGNPEHPANQKETELSEPENLLEAFIQHEQRESKKSRNNVLEWIQSDMIDADKFRKIQKTNENLQFWKKKKKEFHEKDLRFPSDANHTALQHAIDIVKQLKIELFEAFK